MIQKKISDFTNSKDNNFNFIRFLAATGVLYSHCYPLSIGGMGPIESFFGKSWGGVAVDIFFISSGFLIANSFYKRKSNKSFIMARILRIYPGLIFAVLFSALVIGGLATNLGIKEYLSHPSFRDFVKYNSLLVIGNIRYAIADVFANNYHKYAINGSLWTLPYEVKMYFYLFVSAYLIELLEKIKKHKVAPFFYTILTMVFFVIYQSKAFLNLSDITLQSYKLSLMFSIGVCIFFYKHKIKLTHFYFVLSSILLIVFSITNRSVYDLLYILLLPYILFYLIYIPKGLIRKFNTVGDYSYGIYIYAFPIQQIIIFWYKDLSIISFFFLSFICTLIISIISWFLIEKNFLALKNRF